MDDNVSAMFAAYKETYNRAQGQEEVDLQTIGTAVENSLRPNSDDQLAWNLFAVVGEAFNLASFFPETEIVQALLASVQSAYDLSSTFAADATTGSPQAEAINTQVKMLNAQVATQYSNVAAGMDNLAAIVITDDERLSALGPLANTASWTPSTDEREQLQQQLQLSARRTFTRALMPVAYSAFQLTPSAKNPAPTTTNCVVEYHSNPYTGEQNVVPFPSTPANAQLAVPSPAGLTVWALGHGSPYQPPSSPSWSPAPASLIDPFFLAPVRAGSASTSRASSCETSARRLRHPVLTSNRRRRRRATRSAARQRGIVPQPGVGQGC